MISKKQYYIIAFAAFTIILAISIFKYIDYLVNNKYIVECFSNFQPNSDRGTSQTNHNVNLPLTTTYSCKNMCGPTSRCSISGQQCFSDVDCPGCQPYVPPLPPAPEDISGQNDAGISVGRMPMYSTLTTDIGTEARIVIKDKNAQAPLANFGVNTWRSKFDTGRKLFDQRYKPAGLPNMPNYPPRYTDTGMFIDEGPLASNSYLS